jgi:hypothetical protein
MGADGMTILKGSFTRTEECGMDPFGPGQRPVSGYCKYNNKLWGFIKGGEFLVKIRKY